MRPAFAPGLDGEGARLNGGRWNPVGVPVICLASSLALAALESFVHLPETLRRKGNLPRMVAVGVEVPDALVARFDMGTLPPGYGIPDCQAAGETWSKARGSLGLFVPSHLIPREDNLILNPLHPGMGRVAVRISEEFVFDDRLGV